MDLKMVTGKDEIYAYLGLNPALQIYCIGDLDDFFFPFTTWYALYDEEQIMSLALLYHGMEIPTLLLFQEDGNIYGRELLHLLKPSLPSRFYAHLSPGLTDVLGKNNILEHYGMNLKMTLNTVPPDIHDPNIKRLSTEDIEKVTDFYKEAYPHNWFDKRMLETGKYFGYFMDEKLAGVAGIHVYSAIYRVAALGNIAVLPAYRGKQTGYKLTTVLCNDLVHTTGTIGLNVRSDNTSAISLYQKAGFEATGWYEECYIKLK